jgi:DNA primase
VLDLARPLADVIWELETDGKPADTPERQASIRAALLAKVTEIADPEVRTSYRAAMTDRLFKAYRRPWTPNRPGARRPFGAPALPVAPFAAGTAARMSGTDLDSSRQERVLLGALIERPALLHVLAEEVGKVDIANPELRRLQTALLNFLAEAPAGVDPAAEEALGGADLEERLLAEHLQQNGLDRMAQSARTKAQELFREKENEAWLERWHRIAGHLAQRKAAADQLREAEQALASHFTDENWEHFLTARQLHQQVAASETG